jgi:hypothetical protein
MSIDKVAWCLQRIADKTGCAVGVVHHTRKPSGTSRLDVDSSRGASALVNAARIAHVLQTMTENEAKTYGISAAQRGWYMRLDNAKANLQPPADAAYWFRKQSLTIPNGDEVGVIEAVTLVDKRSETANKERQALARDAAAGLATVFGGSGKTKAGVRSVYKALAAVSPHLFDASDKRGAEKLLAAISTGLCEHNGMVFRYEYDETGSYEKHFIVCESLEFML